MLWKKDTDKKRDSDVEAWVTRFTVGEDHRWDTVLLPYDIKGTLAHAKGLASMDLLSEEELTAVYDALKQMLGQIENREIGVQPEDEDCHTVIETYLTRVLGDVGRKIHTGRSRNDQVLTALRLFMKDSMRDIAGALIAITGHLCEAGTRYNTAVMPGYTHLQPAMPSTAGLWAMGYAELLLADLESMQAAYRQIDRSPLGSAAGYGVPFLALPREQTAGDLGFASVQKHVTAVQLSRGKLELHAVHALVQVAATLNRLASDLILFNTREFGFVALPDAFCTGSSIMPQKKNPDVLELVRASYHRLLAEMNVLLTLPANLPSGYHRDLQLTKEAVMRSFLLSRDVADAMDRLLPEVSFSTQTMKEATTAELFATHRALEKVLAGVPFRDAYREAAKESAEGNTSLPEEPLSAYRVAGYPGRSDVEHVRNRLDAFSNWLDQLA